MERTLLICFGAPPPMWTSLSTLAVSTTNRFWSTRLRRDWPCQRRIDSGRRDCGVTLQCTSVSDDRGDTEISPQGANVDPRPKARCVISRWPCATHLYGRLAPITSVPPHRVQREG